LYYFSTSIKGERSIWDVIGAHLFPFLLLIFIVGAGLSTTTACSMEVTAPDFTHNSALEIEQLKELMCNSMRGVQQFMFLIMSPILLISSGAFQI
jgi:hypothetical protein